MSKLIVLVCLLVGILTITTPSPPIWPETFTQDMVQGDIQTGVFQSGKLWYDCKNNRQRADSSGSNFDAICYALGQNKTLHCTSLYVNNSLYVNLPQKSKCCKCCNGVDCTFPPKDWMSDFQYAGEAILSGQKFNKWTTEYQNYYDTEDDQRIPRRVEVGTFGIDFIVNTFSKAMINDTVFQIPNNCKSSCPKIAGCTGSFEEQNQVKIPKQVLFRKSQLRNLKR